MGGTRWRPPGQISVGGCDEVASPRPNPRLVGGTRWRLPGQIPGWWVGLGGVPRFRNHRFRNHRFRNRRSLAPVATASIATRPFPKEGCGLGKGNFYSFCFIVSGEGQAKVRYRVSLRIP